MNNYTTKEQVEALLKRDLDADELVIFPQAQQVAQSFIDNQTNSTFGDVTETSRRYDGGRSIIDTDPVRNVTSIELLDRYGNVIYTYVAGTDYEMRPINSTIKTWIAKKGSQLGGGFNDAPLWFPNGVANIQVTGKFTSSESTTVPNDIQFLAAYLISKAFQQVIVGDLKRENIEGYERIWGDFQVRDEIVKNILDKYVKDVILL